MHAQPPGPAIDLPASPDGRGVLIVMNASAGNDTVHADPRPVIEKTLPAATLRLLARADTFESAVAEAMAGSTPPRVLGVCGGDGSVSRMAHLARAHDLPLLILPGGTFNHVARSVGLSSLDAGFDALRQGSGLWVAAADLTLPTGEVKTVLNAAAVGIYPDFVAARAARKKTLGKWLGGVAAAFDIARRARPIDVTIDGETASVWSLFVSVGRNDPAQIAPMQRRTLHDDMLDVRVLPARVARLRAVASLAFGRKTARVLRALGMLPPRREVRSFTAPELTLTIRPEPGQAAGFTHDGELEMPADSTLREYRSAIRVEPRALRIYAPHHPRQQQDAPVGQG